MKAKDATYYAEQINSGTVFHAASRGGELIVRDKKGGRVIHRTRNEYLADQLYKQLVEDSLREASGNAQS